MIVRKDNMKKGIRRILVGCMMASFLFSGGFVSAEVPSVYYPDYQIRESWDAIMESFSKIESYSELGEDVPVSVFSRLNKNFKEVIPHFPKKPDYKITYQKCLILSKKLSENYDYDRVVSFRNECFQPLNKIIKEINKNSSVRPSVTANPKNGSAPLTVTLDARNSKDPSNDTIPSDNFFWYYKDTNGNERVIGKGPVINHTFSNPGTYIVHLTVRSVNSENKGIFDGEETVAINVGPKSAVLSVYVNGNKLRNDYAVKVGTEEAKSGLLFDGSGTHPTGGREIQSYVWSVEGPEDFSYRRKREGSPGNLSLSLPQKGRYNVSLKIRDNQGNEVKEEYPLVVSDPVAVIKQNPEEGNTSTVFNFDASTSYSVKSSIKTYKWTIFGPNGEKIDTFEGKSFQRKFSTPGNYTVKLTVIDDLGNENQNQRKINVASTPPKAQFKIDPVAKWKYPSQFVLDASLSYDEDNVRGDDPLEYEWGFSNNEVVDVEKKYNGGKKILVSFNESGKFQVNLQVKDSFGKITEKTREISVESSLRPRMIVDPLATRIDKEVSFGVDVNKNIMSYSWDFGDGTTKQTQSRKVKHSYETSGVFEVTLKVRTQSGETNEVSKDVFVGEKDRPIAAYQVSKGEGILSSLSTCLDKKGGEVERHDAYLVNRYESFRIDASNSRNVKGKNQNLDIYFQPKNGETKNESSISYEFSEIGCQYIDLWVEDTKAKKNDKKRIWFKVKNALPTLDDIQVSFPQYGNEVGIGFRRQRKEEIFESDYDPLLVRTTVMNERDPDGRISHFVWYYYKENNPDELLEVKTTPANITNTTFAVPKRPGNFVFGVKMVDNDGGEIKSEEIIGKGPSVFFPPSTKNPDIPMVTLKTSPVSTAVGEKVNFSVDAEILSSRDDFTANRYIKYDFDGDGIYDLTTKKSNVTHRYETPGEYKPKAKVVYRGYAGVDYGEEIDVKKGLKVDYLYDTLGKKVMMRDASYGEIEKKEFCMNLRKCRRDESLKQMNKDFFFFEYNEPGKYYTSLLAKDKYGNKEFERKKINIENLSQEEKKKEVNVLSLPEYDVIDGKKKIEVGRNLDNSVLFYFDYRGGGKCYVDADISVDSDGDGNPEKDKDFECNKIKLHSYTPKFSSTIMRVYYGTGDSLKKEDINISFLDVNMSLSDQQKKIYKQISTVLNSLDVEEAESLSYLKTLLINLRNGLGDRTEIDSIIIQIKDWIDRNPGVLEKSIKEDIDEILNLLSDEAIIGALSDNEYEKAKSDILIFVPSDVKDDIESLFQDIESANGDKEKIKNSLQKILDIAYKQKDKENLDETDLNIIRNDVCKILEYYSIPSEACGGEEEGKGQKDDEDGDEEEGSLIWSIINIIFIILGVSVVFFIILIVVFALKAKKQKNLDAEPEEETTEEAEGGEEEVSEEQV